MSSLSRHSAAAQAGGYYFQLDRALYQLALNPTSKCVGVETLDDVCVQQANGCLVCEQDKSTTDGHAEPLGDRRKGLWSSLLIWADGIATQQLDPAKTEFHLVTNSELGNGLAFTISRIESDDKAVTDAVTALRTYAPTLPDSVRPLAEQLLRHNDDVLGAVLKKVRCYSMTDGVSGTELRTKIAAHLRVPPKLDAESVVNALLGWLHDQVIRKIFAKEPAWITTDAFNTQLQAVIDRHQNDRYREWPVSRLLVTAGERAANQGRVFVEQLGLIGSEDDEVVDAINDFIRFGRERLRLSHDGEITDEEWGCFDTRLIEHWKPIHRANKNVATDGQEAAGRQVYSTVQQHREILGGCQTIEFYFTRGAYHSLADRLDVGWHPKFRDRLQSKRVTP